MVNLVGVLALVPGLYFIVILAVAYTPTAIAKYYWYDQFKVEMANLKDFVNKSIIVNYITLICLLVSLFIFLQILPNLNACLYTLIHSLFWVTYPVTYLIGFSFVASEQVPFLSRFFLLLKFNLLYGVISCISDAVLLRSYNKKQFDLRLFFIALGSGCITGILFLLCFLPILFW